MTINKLLTIRNFQNYNSTSRIKYIVIHYVGATGGAKDNCDFFYKEYRGASAHYFVGHNGEIWQCVDDADIAWHCGGGLQGDEGHTYYKKCTNTNSIGIELCCRVDKNGRWYFEQATINAAIELTKMLMQKYGVSASNVIRHYDVTGKNCPEPFVRNKNAWNDFKNSLTTLATVKPNTTNNNFPTCPFTVEIKVTDLNIRSAASMSGIVVGQTGKGVFTIVETRGEWGKLKSGKGWIYLSNQKWVTIQSKSAASATTGSYKVRVTASVLNVRAGAGTGYKVTTTVKRNEVYTIVATQNNWGKLKSGAGWICLDFTERV